MDNTGPLLVGGAMVLLLIYCYSIQTAKIAHTVLPLFLP